MLDVGHGGTVHVSASDVAWPMHLPYVDPEEQRAENIDRNARAYGWEIGRGAPLVDKIEYSPDNPFLNPNWRENIQ